MASWVININCFFAFIFVTNDAKKPEPFSYVPNYYNWWGTPIIKQAGDITENNQYDDWYNNYFEVTIEQKSGLPLNMIENAFKNIHEPYYNAQEAKESDSIK